MDHRANDEQLPSALRMHEDGVKHAEIADTLGYSGRKSVDAMISKVWRDYEASDRAVRAAAQ